MLRNVLNVMLAIFGLAFALAAAAGGKDLLSGVAGVELAGAIKLAFALFALQGAAICVVGLAVLDALDRR